MTRRDEPREPERYAPVQQARPLEAHEAPLFDIRYDTPSYSSCLGQLLFLFAFVIGLLYGGPLLAVALAGPGR